MLHGTGAAIKYAQSNARSGVETSTRADISTRVARHFPDTLPLPAGAAPL
jgi:hypothetical protein